MNAFKRFFAGHGTLASFLLLFVPTGRAEFVWDSKLGQKLLYTVQLGVIKSTLDMLMMSGLWPVRKNQR
jgi:hypothetical protein